MNALKIFRNGKAGTAAKVFAVLGIIGSICGGVGMAIQVADNYYQGLNTADTVYLKHGDDIAELVTEKMLALNPPMDEKQAEVIE